MNTTQIEQAWSEYVSDLTTGMSQLQIAEHTGLAQTNIGKWLRGEPGIPRAESVIAFARSFRRPPMEALVASGYLTTEEVTSPLRPSLSVYEDGELIAELGRRYPADVARPAARARRARLRDAKPLPESGY